MIPWNEELKTLRLGNAKTLEDIARKTKIRPDLLEKIEAGDSTFVPPPYLRAFIREYAESIGIDPERAIARYERKITSIIVEDAPAVIPEASLPAAKASPALPETGEVVPAPAVDVRQTPAASIEVALAGDIVAPTPDAEPSPAPEVSPPPVQPAAASEPGPVSEVIETPSPKRTRKRKPRAQETETPSVVTQPTLFEPVGQTPAPAAPEPPKSAQLQSTQPPVPLEKKPFSPNAADQPVRHVIDEPRESNIFFFVVFVILILVAALIIWFNRGGSL